MSITGLFLILSAQLVFISGVLAQGSLTPPGAPGQTMKTLDQVEPRTDLATVAGDATYHHVILQPGSYYLSGNLAVTKTSGINIRAAGVTLDLNGFEISRASGSGGYGVILNNTADRATVRNGSIAGFSTGIKSFSNVYGCLLEKLSASGCAGYGIEAGSSARIIDCRSYDNQGGGILADKGSSLQGCTADSNQGIYGISASTGSSLEGCTVRNHQGSYGISAGNGSSLIGCTASENQSFCGIITGEGATLNDCAANNNQANYGIRTSSSTLRGCTARNNKGTGSVSYGIYASESTVVGCSAISNTNTNSPGTSSHGTGIYIGSAGVVKDCNASGNKGDGIRIGNDCLVSGNQCDSNGNGGDGAGIHAINSDNRIDENNVTDNDRGIEVGVSTSIIVRNTASGNSTNYDIAAGNDTGTIQTSPVGAGAWDNFIF